MTRVFFISAAAFGALSLYGYTTQRDLSPIGSFLLMGLIGLIIALGALAGMSSLASSLNQEFTKLAGSLT